MISLDHLTKRSGERIVVDAVTLEVPEGAALGLVGAIGSGKTTLLRMLVGLAEPDSGTASVGGIGLADDPRAVRRLVGYLPEATSFYRRMTLREDLELHAGIHGARRSRRRGVADGLLEVVDLADQRNLEMASLTSGQRRRLGLARALVHDPKVLLLDEPVAGLDPDARTEIWTLLGELSSLGKTMIVTARSPDHVSPVFSSTATVDAGRVTAPEVVAEAHP